jgi:hypothetical protein
VGGSTTSGPVSITVAASTPATRLIFTASTDHNTNVTSYTLEIFTQGTNPSTAPPVSSRDLGKPAVVSGDITVDIAPLIQALAPGNYFGTVTAIGPGGSTRRAASNTFSCTRRSTNSTSKSRNFPRRPLLLPKKRASTVTMSPLGDV